MIGDAAGLRSTGVGRESMARTLVAMRKFLMDIGRQTWRGPSGPPGPNRGHGDAGGLEAAAHACG
jgi:hypothetical protein